MSERIMSAFQGYKYWITRQLPEIADARDRECVEEEIARCYSNGFTREDALAFVSLTEHVNPLLSEREALDNMAKIAKKYRMPTNDEYKSMVEAGLAKRLQEEQPAILFDVKQLARAVKLACKHREESYDGEGYYKLDMDQACMAAVQELNLPKELWQMVTLSLHWWNDINDWADSVLNDTFDKDYETSPAPADLVDMDTPDMMNAKKGGKKS